MITILPGEVYYGKYENLYCILGSCVGIVIYNKDKIGITHGRLKKEVANQIDYMVKKFDQYDKIILLGGGMNGEGFYKIGQNNIDAAYEILKDEEYEDKSGEMCVIKFIDGELIINKRK